MKTFATCFLLIGALLAVAHAYPASESKQSDLADDAEFIVVPLEHQRPSYFNRYPSSFDSFDGVVDTEDFPHPGQSPVFFPSVNPFTWQFSSYLDDLMKRLRDRFSGSWNPFYGGSDFAHSGPGVWPIEIPDDDSSEDAQTNSTSTVKIIDGHKVIINDTYYTKKTDFGTSIYKVRVIDVKPAEEGETEKPSTEEKPVETGNRNGSDNDDETTKKEAEGESDNKEPTTVAPKRDTELDNSDEETAPVDDSVNSIDSNTDIDAAKKVETDSFYDQEFGGDFLAELKSAALSESDSVERNVLTGAPHKDREDVSSAEQTGDDYFSPDDWKQHQDDRKRIVVSVNGVTRYPVRNQNQNQFDVDPSSASETLDLSNDIAINDMLADQSIPLHPDVEVFAPNRRRPAQQDPMQPVPMFPGFPQSFPGGNRFPFPNQFPQQFPNRYPQQFPQYPQRPIGQFPVQAFPVFPGQLPNPGPFGHGQQHPVQQIPVQQRPGGFGQQTPILMMTFPPNFPAAFRDVRP